MDYSLEKFTSKSKDEDILEIFDSWLKESQTYHDELLTKQKVNYQYYIGNQTDLIDVPDYLSNTVENRIFEGVETLVPVATASAHQFLVMPGSEEETSKQRSEKLQKVLSRKYETLEVQKKLEDVTRKLLILNFGVLKYYWDFEKNDVAIKEIDPRLILIPKLRLNPHDLPYTMEIQSYKVDEIKDYFEIDPEKEGLAKGQTKVESGKTPNDVDKNNYQVFEVWTDETVIWISSNKVLKKIKNPHYDWTGEDKNEYNELTRRKRKVKKFYNHLDKPEKSYIFFNTFNISDAPISPISLVEICLPIQDAINSQKRSIINNLKQMGNGQVYVDDEALSEEETENITNEPGLVLRGKNLASENRIKREAGVQLPNAHFANLQHSEVVFDNIMGVHSATRGQAQAKTLGQDILSRQQDFTRIDTITRVLNRGVARLANGLVQLMKMYYTEANVIKLLGEEGATEFVTLNREEIEDNIEIIVKSGQTLPMDEVSLRTEAIQLWQFGAISPVTLFERLKFPNPEKEAMRLLAYQQGQLDMETQTKIQSDQANAQAKAETPKTAGQGRGGETVLDVLRRAREQLGSTPKVGQSTGGAASKL